MEDRLKRLEEKVAFVEHALGELNEVVAELNRQVLALERQWRDVRTAATEVDTRRSPEEDRPPHYGRRSP